MSKLTYEERLTPRDRQMICSIGNHRVLSKDQLIYMYFTDYDTFQYRIREVLKPAKGNYVSDPFYLDNKEGRKKTVLYRLETAGKKEYKKLTGKKYYTPRWSLNYLPHLIETNWILILLSDVIDDFQLEKRIGMCQIDAYCRIKDKHIALEIDLSETETKREIQRQFENYQKLYTKTDDIDLLVFFTNREYKLLEWTREIVYSDLEVKFVARTEEKLNKLKKYLSNIK
ncbi:MAG: replication-relaxation family protein [Halanaerobiales bacterium]